MGKIPLDPPATDRKGRAGAPANARAVARRLEGRRRPNLPLASARGRTGAQDALAALYGKIRATEFEIECNDQACGLGTVEGRPPRRLLGEQPFRRWRPEEIIAGIESRVVLPSVHPRDRWRLRNYERRAAFGLDLRTTR